MVEKYGVGSIHKTNEGYNIEIIEKTSFGTRRIKFLDNFEYERNVYCSDISSGKIRNPYHRSICGFGIRGNSPTRKIKSYSIWSNMIHRIHGKNKVIQYSNVCICEDWIMYDNFKHWFDKTYPKHLEFENMEFDKDLLQIDLNFKIYSPKTCLWLPSRVNKFLHTSYKNNSSGHVGVVFDSKRGSYISQGTNFEDSKAVNLGRFKNKEDAINSYKNHRELQSEKAKQYLRDLNYLPEEIINLIK